MNPVGADHHIAFRRGAVFERHARHVAVPLIAGAPVPGMHHAVRQGFGQHVHEIRAMHAEVAFQPDESVTWTEEISVPSWWKYRELLPTLAPHFDSVVESHTLQWRTQFGGAANPCPTPP